MNDSAQPIMRVAIEYVDPGLAKEMLRFNTINRSLRGTHVDFFKELLRRGKFGRTAADVTHQPIAIATDGTLLDGQHRLTAIVETGIGAYLLVATDCDKRTFPLIDRGRSRSTSDALHITNREAAIGRLLFGISQNLMGWGTITDDQVSETLDWAREPMSMVGDAVRTTHRKRTAAPVATACVVRVMEGGRRATHAIESFRAFVALGEMPPACLALLRQIDKSPNNLHGRRIALDLTARAWIAFDLQRRDLERIQINDLPAVISEMSNAIAVFRGVSQTGLPTSSRRLSPRNGRGGIATETRPLFGRTPEP